MTLRRALILFALLGLTAMAPVATDAVPDGKDTKDASPFSAMKWRLVGPFRGGRSAAVAGVPGQPQVYYFGSAGGGVWKTGDGGWSWKPISDGFFGGSIGAVAVSEWDPNIIYVGGGEKTVRGNVSHGDGMWKSTDAGATWTAIGLEDSRRIPRIRIHPTDPDTIYAAVLGHLFGSNPMRGVYRSTDGGVSWERILHVNDDTGAVDLAMDPTNPRMLYATFWRIRRTPYSLESGGEGSGIWKSTDGGDSWTEISRNPGLPQGEVGIAGITVSPTNPRNLYAIIEAEDGGVFRSRDGGATWQRTNKERSLRQRAWYYTRIYADPASEEAVYVLNVRFYRSGDGGKSFTAIPTPHGDNHDLWIDPHHPTRMVQANDGGANVSIDGGKSWTPQNNQPTAQFYRVSTDNHFPYRILGAQQDNSTVRIAHRSPRSGIGPRDWEPTAGGESGHVVAHPENPEIVYGGSYGGFLTRVDHATGELRAVNVWPDNPMGWGAAELKYRFQWNFPLFFSPHDAGVLYAAGNLLFRTTDEGQSWEPISPDLTRNDKSKQGPSGGPITKDNTSVEYYSTIFAAAESFHEKGVIWTGSDDGLLHLSRDGGDTWDDVTPPRMPEWMQINGIEIHPFEPGGLYVAGTRYKLDDFRPYLYRTIDYGRSWKRIDAGIPEGHFTRAIRADPSRHGLLYAGTERGVWVSFDDGSSWESLQLNLPVVPVTDLAIKEGDLIAATQGRSFWALDDLSPLAQFVDEIPDQAVHLYSPRDTYRLARFRSRPAANSGTNPPAGVIIHYHLQETVKPEEITLRILEENGDTIVSFTGEKKDKSPPAEIATADEDEDEEERFDKLPTGAGMNRFVWDLGYPGASRFPGLVLWGGGTRGPRALPGTYRLQLEVAGETRNAAFTILPDPRSSSSQADLARQFEFLLDVRDKISEAHVAITEIRAVQAQLEELQARLEDSGTEEALARAITALDSKMTTVEEALYQTRNQSRQDPLNFPIRLNDKLSSLAATIAVGDFRPTRQAEELKEELFRAVDVQLDRLAELWKDDLVAMNTRVQEKKIPALTVPTPATANGARGAAVEAARP